MSKKAFKSQASSSRAVSGTFGGASGSSLFGSGFGSSAFAAVSSSPLSYVYEPPDLSGLSDANVGVAFKNVQKKDGTTKAKALEDLQAYVSSLGSEQGGMEEAMLEAWVKVYPRTSIDNSRRVRQLAHNLQGQIALSCGKRMAKHMPVVVSSWSTGLYDNDKSVSRAANESFDRVFSSNEKRSNVWRLYQFSILEYSTDVIAKETPTTLSDERTTSPDDATAKYFRVVGAAVMMVTNLLENTREADLEKIRALQGEFLNLDKLWKLTTCEDAFVRRALYRLLIVALAKQKNSLNPSIISANVLTSGLHTKQTGSAFDFARAITILSQELPDVWTLHYTGTGKKSAQSRLNHFFRRGSQGGPPDFWSTVSSLLSSLPHSILTSTNEDEGNSKAENRVLYSTVLPALREGINSKGEGRMNRGSAWNTYLDAFELVQASLPESVDRPLFYEESLVPILTQYIRPLPDQSSWAVSGPQHKSIVLRTCNLTLQESPKLFEKEWQALSTKIVEDFKTSLPEQSKEYAKSQDSISAMTDRWYQLQSFLVSGQSGSALTAIFERSVPDEITSALAVIQSRNGKPYGAAAAVNIAVQSLPDVVLSKTAMRETLVDFANTVIPDLLISPSAKYLVQLLGLLEDKADVSQAYEKCMRTLAEVPDSEPKSSTLQIFTSSPLLAHNSFLSTIVMGSLQKALRDDNELSWKLAMAAISNSAAPKRLTDDLLLRMIGSLSIHTTSSAGLHGLEMAIKQRESIVKDFVLSTKGSSLISALLSLSESDEETVSQKARGLSGLIERAISISSNPDQATKPMLETINSSLDAAEADSLRVDILVSQAQRVFEQASPDNKSDAATKLLPDLARWNTAIEPFFWGSPNLSLAITNSLSGALSLITPISSASISQRITTDGDGYSSAFRMFRYTTKLIESTKAFEYITSSHKAVLVKSLALLLQIAGDNLSVPESIPLWKFEDPDQEAEVVDFVAETQALLACWFALEPSPSDFVHVAQIQLLEQANGQSTKSYYSARAYAAITAEKTEIHGHRGGESDADRLKTMRKSTDIFASAAYLASAPGSKELQRLCNELIADLTGLNFQKNMENGLQKLVLLSCIFHAAEDYVTDISQQRLVFFVKHIIQQLEIVHPTSVIGGQITSTLFTVLPPINGIYGEFWSDVLEIVGKAGLRSTGDESLYGVHSCLRLLSLLRRPHMQEANDDLLDAWNEKKGVIEAALLDLMKKLADTSDESHQPRRIVNELLGRQLAALSKDLDVDVDVPTLYPVLASEAAALQQASYELLHNHIPSGQEQISIDKALSADYVPHLPQELLSLILTAPTMESLAGSNFERTMPPTLRSYLMSWKLTVDHWQNASYKVQADYVAELQEGTYVQDFLNFALNILVNVRAKPIDASKFDIENYTPGLEESPEKETHWLLIHLYYLCLRHLPSITKTWWRDSTSRQLNLAVSSWTEKHISPLIIASELTTITDWAPSQATADQPMIIKVSTTAREITASIPIDEQTMTIAIHLPKSYPLARAEVTSVHRVAVAEKKWNSWLINTQGVINFSSGGAGEGNALIDGLMAWRKNVTAAMKGQTECAICYSVVSGDRQLPSKKCQTCKNTFHSSCLFRWFKSSNSSSCPLCRNAFNYS